ncbi:CBS domain-containing protein [Nocardioides bruguierae]|uniref:CBS domain-containing protein n=1 Tax=Nocardioides bruguierae TaxID=2945102 RepID=A0A9X2D6L2_9ACTN|nr:CBS domain-containing protein [Nocardioides bruguierae]MCL8025156.1 CBS domain-containing protein [Nocardioides bruguierae]MCM0620030.1 CBS domain-containing protein [Nocardioides bruguierae]
MLVHEVMTSRPISIGPRTRVKSAMRLLATNRLTSLPVVSAEGRLVGIVSEADLLRDALTPDARARLWPTHTPASSWDAQVDDRPAYVEEVMNTHVLTVHPSTDLAVAVELLTTTGAKSMPVLDAHDRVVGIISRSDVVRVLARSDADLERDLDAELLQLGHPDWLVEVHEGVALVEGPMGPGERALAELAGHDVPGVTEVHVL